MCITIFILFINLLNAPKVDALALYEDCDTPSMIGAFYNMGKIINESGNRYGKLVVQGLSHFDPKEANRAYFKCVCDCGNERIVMGKSLRSNIIYACLECSAKRRADNHSSHGDCRKGKTKEYFIWRGIKERCLNPRNKHYFRYGGRGITMCEKWKNSYADFLLDMGRKPSDKHSIERNDNEKGYSPENCKWATQKEQTRNTRQNKILTFNGVSLCVAEWAEKLNVKSATLHMRVHRGWSVDRILTQDVLKSIKTKRGDKW